MNDPGNTGVQAPETPHAGQGRERPYHGLRVIDLTTTLAGPYCTRLLADLGADVVKIEAPDGDMQRSRPPQRNGASTMFGQLNAGKRSVVLDLKREDGVRALLGLVRRADLLVENFRPGVMQRLGLGYERLAGLNPRLIYCAISGYGQTGPAARRPAYAPVVHAASGYDLAHLAYQKGRSRPDWCGIFTADIVAGVYAFGAIGAALHQRGRSGRGQCIDVSMLETMLALLVNEVQDAQFDEPLLRKPLYGPLRTADGYVMAAAASDKTFRDLSAAAGRPELVDDPRFNAYLPRREHWDAYLAEIEKWSAGLSTAACLEALERFGVPASPYRTVAQALADPQLAHRGALASVQDRAGGFQVVNPPFRMSDAEIGVGPWSPDLGQHTAEVLGGLQGPEENRH